MKRIVTVVATAGAVAMFLVQPAAASANCLEAPTLKPIAYQSGSAGFAPQIDFLDLEGHVVFSGAGEVAGERVTVD
jgi:hypothetical protein